MNFDDNTTVSFDDNLTPVDYIRHIFDRTDLDGIAYIPGWHYDRPGWMTNAPPAVSTKMTAIAAA